MKRFLLSIALFAGMILPAAAVTDGQVYPEINGMNIVNQWIFDRVHTPTAYANSLLASDRTRTATMLNGYIYVGRSQYIAVDEENMQSVILVFNAEDGSFVKELPLTVNGNPYVGLLAATSVGKDNFGHLWVAPMTSTAAVSIPVYLVDTETGELTLMTTMDKGDVIQRTDYLDVLGDITLEQAECNIMTAAGSSESTGFPTLYRWHGDQGDGPDDWYGGFEGEPYMDLRYFYPETKTGLSLAPVVKMLEDNLDEDARYSGLLFYIDCYDAAPVLYDIDGNIVDTFEYTDPDAQPRTYRGNGVLDFTVDDRAFMVYVSSDMNNDGNGCQAKISEYSDPAMSFESLVPMWTIPADSLGKVNDGGLRVHCFATEKSVDDQGNEVVTLLTYKCQNGMAVYKIGKNVQPAEAGKKGDVDGNGNVDGTDLNILINILLGKDQNNYDGRENVDGQGAIDGNDLNALINILLGK